MDVNQQSSTRTADIFEGKCCKVIRFFPLESILEDMRYGHPSMNSFNLRCCPHPFVKSLATPILLSNFIIHVGFFLEIIAYTTGIESEVRAFFPRLDGSMGCETLEEPQLTGMIRLGYAQPPKKNIEKP